MLKLPFRPIEKDLQKRVLQLCSFHLTDMFDHRVFQSLLFSLGVFRCFYDLL